MSWKAVVLVTAAAACAAPPLWAQTSTPVSQPGKTVVYPGAVVRVKAPSLGNDWFTGKFATANVRGASCLGAAIKLPNSNGSPSLILLKGISQLEVDRRTNQDALVMGLEPAGPDDWQTIDLTELRAQDSACPLQGKPAG